VIRISIDTKANLNIGPFSRGGYNRCHVQALDHDFGPLKVLKPFGIFLPEYDESYFYFTESHVTADFMVDSIEDLWPTLQKRFNPHTIVINADNGPENSSRRSQFIERIVTFASQNQIDICLAYYPPYHSKYNPIERVWAVLENHWRGELIDSTEKALGLTRTMTWRGVNPVVKFVHKTYQKGVTLTKKAMNALEKQIYRFPGIEKWAVDIHRFN